MKVSEPKMPGMPYRPPEGYSTDDLYEYGLAVRAAVLAEVRAVVPSPISVSMAATVEYAKGYAQHYHETEQALTTLEQQP